MPLAALHPCLVRVVGLGLLAGLTIGAVSQAAGLEDPEPTLDARSRPNIVLFIADDLGWADTGAYGNCEVVTPNVDRLAEESLLFTHAFAASPLCTPSRCTIETGLMPQRHGGHRFNGEIGPDVRTLPSYLGAQGYRTAHFGKFHHDPPESFAYDEQDNQPSRFAPFLREHDKERPFFAVVATYEPHLPWPEDSTYDPASFQLPRNFVDTPETRDDRARYYAQVTAMDKNLGGVVNALERNGYRENTLLVFTSDQGPNWPFAKWCLYDDGLRVPLLARWPAVVAPDETDAMVSLADLLPTFVELAGGGVPAGLDGLSLVSVLTGAAAEHREFVFGTHSGNSFGTPGPINLSPARTIRSREFRYIHNLRPKDPFTTQINGVRAGQTEPAGIESFYQPFWDSWVRRAETDEGAKRLVQSYERRRRKELFDVAADPEEMRNLAGRPEHAEVLRDLENRLLEWCREQGDTAGELVLARSIQADERKRAEASSADDAR